MITQQQWNIIRCVVDKANKSCSHVSIATVNADGSPHVTPIGTLALHDDPSGYFFDELCTVSRTNLDRNPQLCILAVNAGMPFWIKSLVMGNSLHPRQCGWWVPSNRCVKRLPRRLPLGAVRSMRSSGRSRIPRQKQARARRGLALRRASTRSLLSKRRRALPGADGSFRKRLRMA